MNVIPMNIIEQYERKKAESKYLYMTIIKWAAAQAGIYLTRSWTWSTDFRKHTVTFKYVYDRGGSYSTDEKVVDLRPLIMTKVPKSLTINNVKHDVYEDELTFLQVVDLSAVLEGRKYKFPDLCTVTYQGSWDKGQSRIEGTLEHDACLKVLDGMRIKVTP